MLSIGKLKAEQVDYYVDQLPRRPGEHFVGADEAPGRWIGHGARILGADGPVDHQGLRRLLEGASPVDAQQLVERRPPSDNGRSPLAAYDLTFSAPKGVSLLHALGDERAAREAHAAHRAAVDAGLSYIEREACRTRVTGQARPGAGFVAAAFDHRVSRAGDPQLHTHVVLGNATQAPDERWRSLDGRAIYAEAKTAGYLYQVELRAQLSRRLGVEWTATRSGYAEIAGVDAEALRAFSRRRADIEGEPGAQGDPRRAQQASLDTRPPKERELSIAELQRQWRRTARDYGLDRDAVRAVYHRRPTPTLAGPQLEEIVTALPEPAFNDRRDALQALAEAVPAGVSAAAVEELAELALEARRGGRRRTLRADDVDLTPRAPSARTVDASPDLGPLHRQAERALEKARERREDAERRLVELGEGWLSRRSSDAKRLRAEVDRARAAERYAESRLEARSRGAAERPAQAAETPLEAG